MNTDLFGQEVETTTTKWRALFSCETDEWPTDRAVVDEWETRLRRPFTLDVCASHANTKAPRYFTIEQNGLRQDWVAAAGELGAAWMNPPYSDCFSWVRKALDESARGLLVVALLPSRTDTAWFHLVLTERERCTISFLRGRLRFGDAKNTAPFPSVVVVFSPSPKSRFVPGRKSKRKR